MLVWHRPILHLSAIALIATCAALALGVPIAAAADIPASEQLAERYAPLLFFEAQATPCGPGEAYRPTSVEIVLGQPGVVLRDAAGKVVKEAPTAADLFELGAGYYLDLPGNPLRPGCSYETAYREWNAGAPALIYAHIARDPAYPDRLALQYWFYYTFNDFTDKHESDWEMAQIDFRAASVADALAGSPYELDLAQHGGGEKKSWTSPEIGKDGDRPFVYVATGSHASYFAKNVYLGRSASEGFGCDNTSAASTRVDPQVELLPDDVPSSATAPFAWLAFDGRWGQKLAGANNGPQGPAAKQQWAQPITWATGLRETSFVVPGTQTVGPSVTSFFCAAVKQGATILNFALPHPWLFLLLAATGAAAALTAARRTAWLPSEPTPLRERRALGQILRAAARLYRATPRRFIGIGIIFVPASLAGAALQWLIFHLTPIAALVELDGNRGTISAFLALFIGSLGAAIASVLATAAVAIVLRERQAGRAIRAVTAFRLAMRHSRPLAGATLRQYAAVILLTLSVIGLPVAIWLFIRWSLFAQACVMQRASAPEALGRSTELVRGHWWRTLGFTALIDIVVAVSGPLLGVVLLLLSGGSLTFINLVGSLIYALTVPYAAIALTLYYYDLELRLDPPPGAAQPVGSLAPASEA